MASWLHCFGLYQASPICGIGDFPTFYLMASLPTSVAVISGEVNSTTTYGSTSTWPGGSEGHGVWSEMDYSFRMRLCQTTVWSGLILLCSTTNLPPPIYIVIYLLCTYVNLYKNIYIFIYLLQITSMYCSYSKCHIVHCFTGLYHLSGLVTTIITLYSS